MVWASLSSSTSQIQANSWRILGATIPSPLKSPLTHELALAFVLPTSFSSTGCCHLSLFCELLTHQCFPLVTFLPAYYFPPHSTRPPPSFELPGFPGAAVPILGPARRHIIHHGSFSISPLTAEHLARSGLWQRHFVFAHIIPPWRNSSLLGSSWFATANSEAGCSGMYL